jgi:hypothetical protein
MASNENFPSIRDLAERADALEEKKDEGEMTQKEADEERPLQEIESLCMACREQVLYMHIVIQVVADPHHALGSYKANAHLDPILQGSYRFIFPL